MRYLTIRPDSIISNFENDLDNLLTDCIGNNYYYNADNNNMGLSMYPSDHLPVITIMTLK